MTSATSPSLEDIITGAIPGMPKVVVHNQVLAYEYGADYVQAWFDAEQGKLDPFVLIIEGSLGNEKINGDGYWTGFGVNPSNGQPITTNEWVDRLAPKAAAVVAVGTCATYGGIPAMKNNPTGAMGVRDYLGWNWKSKAGIPIVNIPGCPAQPDNMTETLMYLVFALAGMAPLPELDDQGRPDVAVRPHRPRELQPRRVLRGGRLRDRVRLRPPLPGEARLQGPGGQVQRPVRGWQSGIGGCPNVGGICMACTMPGFPDKYMPFMDEDPMGAISSQRREVHLRPAAALGPQAEHQAQVRQGAGVAAQPRRADHRLRQALVEELTDMATAETPGEQKVVVKEMSWDPITRIVGVLGIHTEIDFTNQQVLKCYSTSMIFRGFDIFMKGIDPRDAHFITSRICGICGDNHCTCSCLNQNMAYGVKPPKLGDYAFNLAESADFMFDHAIFNDCMANVDYSEQMVKETNPARAREGREDAGAALRHPRLQDDRRHHAGAERVHRQLLPGDAAGGALHARDVLPVRRPPHAPVDDPAGRLQRRHHAPDAARTTTCA